MVKKKTLNKLSNKKGTFTIDELNAYKVAYGDPLGYKDYFRFIGIPGISLAALSFILLYTWWFSLIMLVIGAVYGWRVILPKSIEKQYQMTSFNQRNIFTNNMTQILTDEGQTTARALNTVRERAKGEFKEELDVLQARILGANEQQIQEAIQSISKKHEQDIIFVQYMEQMETAMIEGRTNIDTLKDLKNYHNDTKKKQQYFEREKERKLSDLKKITVTMVIFVLASSIFILGLESYIELFTKSVVGWITSILFLVLQTKFYKEFFTYYFDDSITEISI